MLLDIGATTDSTGQNLAQYARMGAIFAERVLGVPSPSVALLSIGEEDGKGDARVQEATELLDDDLRFIGNVEGKDLRSTWPTSSSATRSSATSTIKFFEGLSSFIFDLLRREFRALAAGPARVPPAASPASGGSAEASTTSKLGGSPLLGVAGTVLITHGRAKRRMIGYAVAVAAAPPGRGSRSGSPRPSRRSRAGRRRSRSELLVDDALAERPAGGRRSRGVGVVSGPRPDGRPGGHRGDGPPGRDRGPGRQPDRPWRAAVAALLAGRRPSAHRRRGRPGPRLDRRPPGQRPRSAHPARSATRSGRPSSACSASSSGASPSSSTASVPDGRRRDGAPAAPTRSDRLVAPAGGSALAAVFEAEFGQRTPKAILERHLAETEGDPAAAALARALVVDAVVAPPGHDRRADRAAAPQYPVVQLARMDRALLRCALGEVLHSGTTPARVAIAEWVELARIYSGDPMRRLMNGVLGQIVGSPAQPDATPSAGPSEADTHDSEEGVSGHAPTIA